MMPSQRPPWLPEVDLRNVMRSSERETRVSVVIDNSFWPWLWLGDADVMNLTPTDALFRASFDAKKVTDTSCTDTLVTVIDLECVDLLAFRRGTLSVRAFVPKVAWTDGVIFKAPRDPIVLESLPFCSRCHDRQHRVIHQIPHDQKLWEHLRGLELRIVVSPPDKAE